VNVFACIYGALELFMFCIGTVGLWPFIPAIKHLNLELHNTLLAININMSISTKTHKPTKSREVLNIVAMFGPEKGRWFRDISVLAFTNIDSRDRSAPRLHFIRVISYHI
jgi:hypothetical protein